MVNYSKIFALLKAINASGCELTYKEAVNTFTNGRTESLSSLSQKEVTELEATLLKMVPKTDYKADPLDASRKAIISQFKGIGKSAGHAIAWAEKYGVFGVKKKFNDYNGQELHQLIKNAEKVKRDFIKSFSKKA